MDIAHDESLELFKVDLRLGLLTDMHTDFNLPDTVPIQFQRTTSDDWTRPMAFGISGSNNYDKYLTSRDMSTITLMQDDGFGYRLNRVPAWLPILSLVKYVDTDYSGRYYELRWHTSPFAHFELKRFDGEVESYLPCNDDVLCYLVGQRNAQGQELKFERDDRRRLTRLTSPSKNWLSIRYGTADRIAEINDSRGRVVFYAYNEAGQLVKVTYPSGEVLAYTYDNAQHLLTFSAAPDAKTAFRILLRNEYDHGRIAKQTLANGKSYTYKYYPVESSPIRQVTVTASDGTISDIDLTRSGSIIREHKNSYRIPDTY